MIRQTQLRRLHWGCGDHRPLGWINSDVKAGPGIDVACDIRDGLPISDDWADYIVSIHALPMIPYPDLVPVLDELRRVLRPGGTLRLGLPDLDKAIAAYLVSDRDYFLVPDEEARSPGGKLIAQLLWFGHSVTIFTGDFIEELLLKAGFSRVRHCRFGATASRHPDITELDNREQESLFVEATK